jgi:hypothetical protein
LPLGYVAAVLLIAAHVQVVRIAARGVVALVQQKLAWRDIVPE